MIKPIDYSQLWIEEKQILAERATLVPDNGTIVEIGTAQGGSATIFYEVAGNRGVKIYSYDIAPSLEAYENLKDTSVTIISKPSKEGALNWKRTVGSSIDLLFIDGSHALQHVFEDFNLWVTFLKPGGQIIFHDYDPIERGGLVHFGVRIVLDTIIRRQFLDSPVHQYKMLYGKIRQPEKIQLKAEDCYQTLVELGRRIVRILDTNFSGWILVGEKRFAELIRVCLNTDRNAMRISPNEANDLRANYIVFARPLASVLEQMEQRGIPRDSVLAIDNLQACYILANAFIKNHDLLLSLTSSRGDFFRWEEILFMYEHAFGKSMFPVDALDLAEKSDISELSKLVAFEQVRLVFLSRLLETFVGWKP